MIHPPEWYERQYNNRANIPQSPQILQGWAEDSALARERTPAHLNLAYGDGPGETLDVFGADDANARAKAKERARPVLVHIHGGYWRALSKSDQSFIAPPFVDAGALVVVPDYALAPQVSIEHITLQMARSLAWVWRHIGRFGGDRSRIVVSGHSAGGHLAAMMMACRWSELSPDLPRDLVRCGLSLSGLFELESLRHVPFLAPDLRLSEASALRLSPAWMPAPAKRKLIALVGELESEEFHRHNQLIRERWGAAVVPVCEAVPGRNHMTVLRELATRESRTHRLALGLLGLAQGVAV